MPTMSSPIRMSKRAPGLIDPSPSAKHVASLPMFAPLIVHTSSVHLGPTTPFLAHSKISAKCGDSIIALMARERARASERTDVRIPTLIFPWLTPMRRATRWISWVVFAWPRGISTSARSFLSKKRSISLRCFGNTRLLTYSAKAASDVFACSLSHSRYCLLSIGALL